MQLLTFGHGTATREQITTLLHGADVQLLVDVRTAPGSRRNPHVARTELARWLPEVGIAYRWERDLGGFRKTAADSPDIVWRNDSFRGYAGYARTDAFARALGRVLDEAANRRAVVMCSESVWWRCHRRIIADVAACVHGVDVRHLMHDGRLVEHAVTPGARLVDGVLIYDAGQQPYGE